MFRTIISDIHFARNYEYEIFRISCVAAFGRGEEPLAVCRNTLRLMVVIC